MQLIRAVLYYVKERTKGADNPIAKVVIRCCLCCFWCLEKFFEFINKVRLRLHFSLSLRVLCLGTPNPYAASSKRHPCVTHAL